MPSLMDKSGNSPPSCDILTENVRGIDVERGAAGELNRVFGFKLMKLLEKRLPDIGDGHLTFDSDFHNNNLI
jgi:hypothetical protein